MLLAVKLVIVDWYVSIRLLFGQSIVSQIVSSVYCLPALVSLIRRL